MSQGIGVLFDRGQPPLPSGPLDWPRLTPALPTAPQLDEALQRGWLSALRQARFLRRDDLWRSRLQGEYELKQYLLQMIEWQAQVKGGDVWYTGRYLDKWADPAMLADLPGCFAGWDAVGQRQAFWATVELYCQLARDIAARLSYPYPDETEGRMLSLFNQILDR